MSILRIENLCKSFGRLAVTSNVNMTIEPQERHVIIGPNGAGKTSLLNQISGQLRPSAGRIVLKGADITSRTPEYICQLGLARTFQRNNLFQNLSVLENVSLAVRLKRGNSLNPFTAAVGIPAVGQRAREILALVQLNGPPERLVSELSYGEQRQLEIGLALGCDPEIVLLDEPTSGMSPAETNRMIALIASLPRTLTLLMIEHDMNVVFSIADRITVLHFGEVLASGAPAEIAGNPAVRNVYLGALH
jgi:branched-chain amino acid transport system ATP-binding protein